MAIKINIGKVISASFSDPQKRDCKNMCKANFGFDKELEKACKAACKTSNPPQSRDEFLESIGQSGDFYLQDEFLAERVIHEEDPGISPVFLLVALGLVGAIVFLTLKLVKN